MSEEESSCTPEASSLPGVSVPDPSSLLLSTEQAARIYSDLTQESVNQLEFFGKTLAEWVRATTLELPREWNGNVYREALGTLFSLLQMAGNYHGVACAMADALADGVTLAHSDVVRAIVDSFAARGAKRPAGAVIQKMADSYMASSVPVTSAARLVKQFWRQRADLLLEQRRILELIGISLHVEMKNLGG
jgi:hypothetical protein